MTRSPASAASAAETGLKPSLDRQVVVRRARPLADHDVAARVAEVLGLGVPLAAVADDGDRLALEQATGRHPGRNTSWPASACPLSVMRHRSSGRSHGHRSEAVDGTAGEWPSIVSPIRHRCR